MQIVGTTLYFSLFHNDTTTVLATLATFSTTPFIAVANLANTNTSLPDGRSAFTYTIANTYPIILNSNVTTAVSPDPVVTLTPD